MINEDDWIKKDIETEYKVADILSPIESAEGNETSHVVDLLNPRICEEFRDVINQSPIFLYDTPITYY